MPRKNRHADIVVTYDFEDVSGYLETPAFSAYCDLVLATIHGEMTMPQIKRALGEGLIDRQLCDALDALKGSGKIRESFRLPVRYSVRAVRRQKQKSWNESQYV